MALFPDERTNEIVSYDYFDIAEGTGIETYYGMSISAQTAIAAHTAQSITWILHGEAIESDGQSQYKEGTTVADAQAFDIDLDLTEFNLPKDIKGNALVTINGTMTAGDPAVNHSACFVFNLYKWDGASETLMGTGYSNPLGTVTNGTNTFYGATQVPITSKVHFKKGDVLRLNVLAYTRSSNAGQGGTVKLYINPTTAGEELKVYIPYNLER